MNQSEGGVGSRDPHGPIRGQHYLRHWPAVFPDVLAQFRDRMILTRVIAPKITKCQTYSLS